MIFEYTTGLPRHQGSQENFKRPMEVMKVKVKAMTQQYHVRIFSENNFQPRFAISVHFAPFPLLLRELSFCCKRGRKKKRKKLFD